MSADPRTEAVARARGPHLYAQRHTPSGAAAWAAWRLQVAGILNAARYLDAVHGDGLGWDAELAEACDTVRKALEEVGERDAADVVRQLRPEFEIHHDVEVDLRAETIALVPR